MPFSDVFATRAPAFTEPDVPDLTGRVAIVTGSTSGVGLALSTILYAKNATVYVCGRNAAKVESAIASVKASEPTSAGHLKPLVIELGDFNSVKKAATTVLQQEQSLHLLVHNAGVMRPPQGSKSASGHDLELATNCLGPHLLTSLLEPLLIATSEGVKNASSPAVRIVWTASLMSVGTPKGGMIFESSSSGKPKQLKAMENYMQSKCGMVFLASEWAHRLSQHKILSVCLHPGMMRTELQRHMPSPVRWLMGTAFKPPVFGAYTELFAALSPSLNMSNGGDYIMPWGYVAELPADIIDGKKSEANGGSGKAQRFWEYAQNEVRPFA